MKVFLSNTGDPKDPNASMYVARGTDETAAEAWQHHLQWLNGKIIGEPRGSSKYTSAELKARGLVGVYADVGILEYIKRFLRGWL